MRKIGTPVFILLGAVLQSPAMAADQAASTPGKDANKSTQPMEEVVVQGRLQTSAEKLVNERINDEVVTDLIGAEMISRIGDSTVASALRRVSGLSLVNDKFVYVRGLGERYSSSTLNGATIPSPDLTRNVIPLDIFPTSIVQSLAVQKSYSPDLAASFGGGNVDIRTKGIPDQLTWSVEVSSGGNSESTGDLLTYPGGGEDKWGTDDGTRALDPALPAALDKYVGQIDPAGILAELRREGNASATQADATVINRQLALNLYRNLSVSTRSATPDVGIKGNVGDNFYLNDDWEAGFLAAAGYSNKWRKQTTLARNYAFPDQRFETENLTTHSVDLNANINLGVRFTEDHKISTTSLYLRNTDDKTSIVDFFNENRELQDGIGFEHDKIRFEERNLIVNQVKGEDYLGEATRSKIPDWLDWLPIAWIPKETHVNWFYSQSRASTDIPNEATITQATVNDTTTGAVQSKSLATNSSAGDFRFTNLVDKVTDYGWHLTVPFDFGLNHLALSGGTEHSQKARTYRQTQFGLGPLASTGLSGPIGEMFSDANITDPANNFSFNISGNNNDSYIAATMTDAAYGKFDWTWNETWRASGGVRWEDYRQVALDWNIYGYSINKPQVTTDYNALFDSIYYKDKFYPSLALTYMGDFWAPTFQLRFGWSKTVVRPDLREITSASYYDPRTGFLTSGNPGVVPAELTNYDTRAEWFFDDGTNLSVTGFYKDIANPIEFFEKPASDTNRAREILNAESGKVYGVEIEGLKNLGFLGDFGQNFFVQGNATIQDSNLVVGSRASSPTNNERKLNGASDYVVNLMLGFDSGNGKHSATLIYNVFGQRLFEAGRRGAPDAFEQPFNSLDVTWDYYPMENLTLKAKIQNLLNDKVTIERDGIEVFEQKPGMAWALSLEWSM